MSAVLTSIANNYSQHSKVGYVKINRTIFSCDLFEEGPFSKRDAFLWLILNAAWKPTTITVGKKLVYLQRGQLSYSLRFLATAWKWSHPMDVKRFLHNLSDRSMVVTEMLQGMLQITICNYDEYPVSVTGVVTEVVTNKNTVNTKKEDNIPVASGSYVYENGVIRLSAADYKRWEGAFTALSLRAELEGLAAWASKQDNWFMALSGALAKRNREVIAYRHAVATAPKRKEEYRRWVP